MTLESPFWAWYMVALGSALFLPWPMWLWGVVAAYAGWRWTR